MSDKYFVCKVCGERVHANAVVMEIDPDLYNHSKKEREFFETLRESEAPKSQLPYHKRHSYRPYGGTSHFYLCGTLEEESEHELFLRWVGALK